MKNIVVTASIFALTISGCCKVEKPSNDDLKHICKELCPEPPSSDPGINVVTDMKWDEESNEFVQSPGGVYIQTPSGLFKHPYKAAELDPKCFSPEPLQIYDNDVRKLDKLALTWDNVTIKFINFTKDGKVESRVLKKGTQLSTDLDKYLDKNGDDPFAEHEIIRDKLSEFPRPQWDLITQTGIPEMDISAIDDSKTPFFQPFPLQSNGYGIKEHVFFYVLLDQDLKFNRVTPGIIGYGPAAENDIGHLYTPYIQYPIAPEVDDQDPPQIKDPTKTEVMTVHFLRENMATTSDFPVTDNPNMIVKCNYPYDIGVVAYGQDGVREPDTPLLIDPENETEGPMPPD